MADELEDLGWSPRDLAERIGRKPQVVERLIRGRDQITKPVAMAIEQELGLSGAALSRLQSQYDDDIAHLAADPSMQADLDYLFYIPWRQFVEVGWIRDVGSDVERVLELRTHYDVESLADVERTQHAAAFRITAGTRVSSWALAAWLQQGEWQAIERQSGSESAEIQVFDRERFASVLPSTRRLICESEFWTKAQALCREAGVLLEFVPQVAKSGARLTGLRGGWMTATAHTAQ